MDSLAAAFPGQGSASGADQPPAFVTGKVARCAQVQDVGFRGQLAASVKPEVVRRGWGPGDVASVRG